MKKEKNDLANYRPVNILHNLSKIYEKLIYQQLYVHFDSILSPKQCGFRKGYSAQDFLKVLLEKFKELRDRGDKFRGLLTDLSKVFDHID